MELRDGYKARYAGKPKAVNNVNTAIRAAVTGLDASDQRAVDAAMLVADGTPNEANLGANAVLAVSMAISRAASVAHGLPLYRHLGGANACSLPVPCMNVLNGGKRADNTVDFEFMIAPHNVPSFADAIRKGMETFHTLKQVLRGKNYSTAVGDEGGFAPDLKSNDEAVELILEAIVKAGYKPGEDISICLDPAASEMWDDGKYVLFKLTKKAITSQELIKIWESWVKQYPIVLLEDGMGENDWEGWRDLTSTLRSRIELAGDDVFCTNPRILQEGIEKGIANAILIKLNQIGSVTDNYRRSCRIDPARRIPESKEKVVDLLSKSISEGPQYLSSLSTDAAAALWRLTLRGAEVFSLPRVWMLRTLLLNHWYHHRGQLSVYLRLLDAPCR